MALTAGIVGLPNVGKSTLFNAITKAGAEAANYPFATIDPNVGRVEVPDARLDKLTELIKPQKKVPTTFEFTDIVDFFEYSFRGNEIRIPFRDILYIETTGSPYKLRVVGKNFFKEFYGTIAEIQEQDKELGYFFSPHKSYLSNISNISGYDKKTKDVLYYDGHRSPISRLRVRYLKEILKAKSKKEENKK